MNILFIATLFVSSTAYDYIGFPAQVRFEKTNQTSTTFAVLGINVLTGCLKGGFGAMYHSNDFWGGCAQGSIAGAAAFLGEWTTTFVARPWTGPIGKLLYDSAVSVQDNLLYGRPPLSQFQYDIGPATITYRVGSYPTVSFSAVSTGMIIYSFARGYKFDWQRSLQAQTFVFAFKGTKGANGLNVGGITLGNTIVLAHTKWDNIDHTFSHELVHAYQWSELRSCNFGDGKGKLSMVSKFWGVGRDACYLVTFSPELSKKSYFYFPPELEAYGLERYPAYIPEYYDILKKLHRAY